MYPNVQENCFTASVSLHKFVCVYKSPSCDACHLSSVDEVQDLCRVITACTREGFLSLLETQTLQLYCEI